MSNINNTKKGSKLMILKIKTLIILTSWIMCSTAYISQMNKVSSNGKCIIKYLIDTSTGNLSFVSCFQNNQSEQTSLMELTWNICSIKCCNQHLIKQQMAFSNCIKSEQSSQSFLTSANILLFTLIFIFTVFICIFGVVQLLKHQMKQKKARAFDQLTVIQKQNVTFSIHQIHWIPTLPTALINEDSSNQVHNSQYSKREVAQTIKQFKNCKICKKQNAEMETVCGHTFHLVCFLQCNKQICPQCKQYVFFSRIYCIECWSQYFVVKFELLQKLIVNRLVMLSDICNEKQIIKIKMNEDWSVFNKKQIQITTECPPKENE